MLTEANSQLNEIWENRIKQSGADFVYFVDSSVLPSDIAKDYTCAVLFGKALSKEYITAMKLGEKPKTKEVFNTEHKMDTLSIKFADMLEKDGYKSIGKLKTGVLPHKTVALRAGLGFIGKNNLLITQDYGCALMLGKILTTAPFKTFSMPIIEPLCKNCHICANICPTNALFGTTWSLNTTREDILIRKNCTLCLKCMAFCPYTAEYIK